MLRPLASRTCLALTALLFLAACGVSETATTAAVQAEAQAKAIEEGKRLEAEVARRVEETLQANQERLKQLEEKTQ